MGAARILDQVQTIKQDQRVVRATPTAETAVLVDEGMATARDHTTRHVVS